MLNQDETTRRDDASPNSETAPSYKHVPPHTHTHITHIRRATALSTSKRWLHVEIDDGAFSHGGYPRNNPAICNSTVYMHFVFNKRNRGWISIILF